MNNQFLEHRQLELEALTPVFVGGGENDLEKVEYIFVPISKMFYVIDSAKMIELVKEKKLLGEYLEYLQKDHKNKNFPLLKWLQKHDLSGSKTIERITKYQLSTKYLKTDLSNQIKCMIKTVFDEPYFPGSSIKGAIRTAIAIDYILGHQNEFNELRSKWRKNGFLKPYEVDKYLIEPIFKELRRDVSGKRGEDFQHWLTSGLSVSDSDPMALQEMMLVQKTDLFFKDNEKEKFPIIMEAMKPKTKTRFSITIDQTKLGQKMGFADFNGLGDVLKRVEEFYIGENGIYQIFENLDFYLPATRPDDRLIFLGGNTGFQSKTVVAALFEEPEERLQVTRKILAYQFKNHKHEYDQGVSPKTLKIVDTGNIYQLMGICALRQISGEEQC